MSACADHGNEDCFNPRCVRARIKATYGVNVPAWDDKKALAEQLKAEGYDKDGQPVLRERDFRAYEDATEEPTFTAYERKKLSDWSTEYGEAEAARRVAALRAGRLAATAKSQAAARAIPSSTPRPDDFDDAGELLRQRGTGSVGAKVRNEEEG